VVKAPRAIYIKSIQEFSVASIGCPTAEAEFLLRWALQYKHITHLK